MATRSTIGYETADGGYVGVYCHYDGYPNHMGPILHRMFHADVVIMVSKALAVSGIRSIDTDGTFDFGEGDPAAAETQWPCCPEQYAYRKRIDGRVEWTDDHLSFREWKPAD